MFRLYVITDPTCGEDLVETTRAALSLVPAGSTALQLRLKDWSPSRRRGAARELRRVTGEAGAALLVNTDLALAREVGADGVHLPERGPTIGQCRAALGTEAIIGVSCHDARGLERAEREGADFATLSPFHAVASKGPVLDRASVRAWIGARTLPIYALGGLSAARAPAAIAAGAAGVAVIRAVYAADDPATAARDLLDACNQVDS